MREHEYIMEPHTRKYVLDKLSSSLELVNAEMEKSFKDPNATETFNRLVSVRARVEIVRDMIEVGVQASKGNL